MNVLPDNSFVSFSAEDRRFVYAVARRIVRSDEDADDVAQDALLLAHRNLASFRGDSKLRTWLYRIATTTALGHLRRAKRTKGHVHATEVVLVAPEKSPETCLADAEMGALVREAIAALSAPYRDVLIARADSTEGEVAARLGLSVANVKVRAHRARRRLRAALARSLDVSCAGVAA